ncbi:Uma2 family endonuclease [Spirulina subsalsa]|uniref:Uma2 family endonuclease n=1 Tax=Spirulina subsalsa TaxID=54311 RepID=UPI0002E900B9|nr:Uma2 family endonuclease [Spirulina subsalsa]
MLIGVRSPRGPDVTVLMRSQWLEMANREAVIDLSDPPPLLVVEVVSPSTRTDDYRSKRAEYGLLEIPEYWIVDPLTEEITICLLENQFYDSVTYQGSQLLQSPLFPDWTLTVTEIFNSLC